MLFPSTVWCVPLATSFGSADIECHVVREAMTKRGFERLEFRRLLSADALWVPEHATSTLKADIHNEAELIDLAYYSKAPSGSTAFHLDNDDVPDLAV